MDINTTLPLAPVLPFLPVGTDLALFLPYQSATSLFSFAPAFHDPSKSTVLAALALALCVYLPIVRLLRWRASEAIQRRYGYTHEQFKNIDYKDAQAILGNLFLLETPWIFMTVKDFAFLRAFGIAAISEVSVKAKKTVEQPGLRYADTMVFATEWIMNPLDSERARLSLNRVNFVHSRYRGIKPDQMVYTLCLLIAEVFRWIDEYDWRESTPVEKYASYVFWKEIGTRMGIAESIIPANFEDCAQFIQDYEEREMGPSAHNTRIASGIIQMYNSVLPFFLRPFFTRVLTTFMDTRLRTALGLSSVSALLTTSVRFALRARAAFVRHCLLPRYRIPPVFAPHPDPALASEGRYAVHYWMMQPWYAPATAWNRWGPRALYARAFGLPIPGPEWASDGYKLESTSYHGRGADAVLDVMQRAKEGGCPYSTFGATQDEASIGGIYAQYAAGGSVGCPMRSKD